MSDRVSCDSCGAVGCRRRGAFAPEGWFYHEAIDREAVEAHGDVDEATLVSLACSVACREKQWKPGPGDLFGSKREGA